MMEIVEPVSKRLSDLASDARSVVAVSEKLAKLADGPCKNTLSDSSPEITLTLGELAALVLNAQQHAVENEFVGRITALHDWANAQSDSLKIGRSTNGEHLSATHPELFKLIESLVNLL
ncbi:MAG: hypothetical protein WC054_00165 [Candidatus Nanopelagicales bacterium]